MTAVVYSSKPKLDIYRSFCSFFEHLGGLEFRRLRINLSILAINNGTLLHKYLEKISLKIFDFLTKKLLITDRGFFSRVTYKFCEEEERNFQTIFENKKHDIF